MREKKWISLKEAAKISGYSADYIGELIRKGKIPGKQVVCNVAWLTTKEAILEYKEKQKKREGKKISQKDKIFDFLTETRRKISFQLAVLKLVFTNFKNIFLVFFLIMLFFFIFLFYFFSSIGEKTVSQKITPSQIEKTEEPTF